MGVDGKYRLLLILSTLIAYSNSLFGDFQFDDYNVIVYNPTVHSLSNWLSDLGSGIRPLLKLSFALNWIVDQSSFGFHLVNLLIHLVNVLLVNSIFTKILSKKFPPTQARFIALVTTLAFALHPVNTEAVTYITGRSVSLMALFYFLSIFLYLRGKIVLSLISFALAVSSKETALTLPLALLLIEVFFRNRVNLAQILRKQVFYWAVFLIALGVVILHPHYHYLLTFSFKIRSIGENFLAQVNGVFYLLERLFILNGMNIDPDLPSRVSLSPEILLKAFALVSLLFTGIWVTVKRSPFGFGILWFFVHLIPTNSFIPRLDVANDRQLYIASIGLFLCVALLVERVFLSLFSERPNLNFVAKSVLAIILIVLFGTFTYLRNLDYKTEVTLWEDTVKKSPNRARAYNNLGYAYFSLGRLNDAEKAYLRALELSPDYRLARDNLERVRYRLREEERHRELIEILEFQKNQSVK